MKQEIKESMKPHQFKPGQSGNPAGRPRSKPLTLSAAYRRELKKVDPQTGKTFAALVAEQVVGRALAGDLSAVMLAFSNDTDKLLSKAVKKLMVENGCSRKQAQVTLSLFMPEKLIP